MAGIFEKLLITSVIKITTVLSKYTLDQIKKDITFYQVVGLLGIEASPKDDYDQLYTQTALIVLKKYEEYHELKLLLINTDVKSAFENEKYNSITNTFSIAINGLLHTNINIKQLKEWIEVPKYIIDDFFETYNALLKKAATPIQKENILSHDITHNKIDDLKSFIDSKFLELTQPVSLYSDILQEEYQRQIKLIASSIEKGLINDALKRLFEIKDDLWEKIDDILKFKVLTNIGVCYSRLDKVEDSCKYFIDALSFNKEDKVALTNAVSAYSILNDIPFATTLIYQLKEKHPDYVMTYVNMIRVFSQNKPVNEILKEIPEKFLNEFEVLFTLGIVHRLNKRFDESIKFLKKAVLIKDENKLAKEYLLNTLLEKYNYNFPITNLRLINKEVKNELEIAINISDEILEFYENSDMISLKVRLHINKGFLYHLLSNYEESIKEMDLALALEPNNTITLTNKAFVLAVMNKRDLAISILKGVVDKDKSPETVCLLAEMYMKDNKVDDAIQLLEKQNSNNATIKSFLIELYLTRQDITNAERVLSNEYSEANISDLISKSKIEFQKQNKEIAKEILNKITSLLNKKNLVKFKYLLAEEFVHQGHLKEAIDIYTSFTNTEIDNNINYKLARLYYLIGEKGNAIKVLSDIRKHSGVSYSATPLEISIYQEYRDYEKACTVAEEYFHKFPNDLLMRIRLTGIYIRLEKYSDADKLLEDNFDFFALNIDSFESYVNQLIIRGFNEKAFYVLYEYRRHYNNSDAHNLYAIKFLNVATDEKYYKKYQVVDVDTAVCLENDEGNRFNFIIENRNKNELKQNEINSDDNKYSLLRGNKIGEKFKLKNQNEIISHDVSIIFIEHKYAFAWHESKKLLETIFADKSKIYTTNANNFKQLLDKLLDKEKQNSWSENYAIAIEYYKKKVLPITTIAEQFSQCSIDTWFNFSNNNKIGIECAFGFSEEWENALSYLNNNETTIVADLISLLTLYELQILDVVSLYYGKILVANSTMDIILDKINSENLFIKSNKTVKSRHEKLYETVKSHCIFFTPQSTMSLNYDYKSSLEKLIGAASFDTIYLAKEKSAIILSDDLAFRRLCKDEHSINGIWTQALLKHLHLKEIISKEQYQLAVFKLTQLNYFHTSIDSGILLISLAESNYSLHSQLTRTIDYLKNNISSEESSILVASRFIIELWLCNNIPVNSKKNILFYTLDTLCFDRVIFNVIIKFQKVIDLVFREYIDNLEESRTTYRQIHNNIGLWQKQYFK